jgi:hypothetical protein
MRLADCNHRDRTNLKVVVMLRCDKMELIYSHFLFHKIQIRCNKACSVGIDWMQSCTILSVFDPRIGSRKEWN